MPRLTPRPWHRPPPRLLLLRRHLALGMKIAAAVAAAAALHPGHRGLEETGVVKRAGQHCRPGEGEDSDSVLRPRTGVEA